MSPRPADSSGAISSMAPGHRYGSGSRPSLRRPARSLSRKWPGALKEPGIRHWSPTIDAPGLRYAATTSSSRRAAGAPVAAAGAPIWAAPGAARLTLRLQGGRILELHRRQALVELLEHRGGDVHGRVEKHQLVARHGHIEALSLGDLAGDTTTIVLPISCIACWKE